MSQTKFRIPRITTAALLVGGAACGGDGGGTPGGTTNGTNVSSSRITAIAKAMCKQYQECDKDDFEDAYDDVDQCIDDRADYLDDQADAVNKACADAALDYLACYSTASCKDLPEDEYDDPPSKCEDFADAFEDECAGMGPDGSSDGSTKRAARAVLRKYRIPR